MNVGELFESLSSGELNNLSISGEGSGTIDPVHQSRIISLANKALTQIFSQMAHKRYYVTVEVMESIHEYTLRPENAVSDVDPDNNAPRYIKDTVEDPFRNNLIKILGVVREDDPTTSENEHKVLGINVRNSEDSIRITSHNSFRVQYPKAGEILTIEYQARHQKLTTPAVKHEDISVAPIFEEALECNIAARVYSSMNGEENIAKGAQLFARFDRLMGLAMSENLAQTSESTEYDRLRSDGWV